MSEKLSYEKLSKIAANQTITIRQQDEIRANLDAQTAQGRQKLALEREIFNHEKQADLRHDFKQMCDFAIRTLPFWNRSPKAIANRATELMLTLKSELGKHAAMEAMAQKLVAEDAAAKLSPEQVAEVKADAEKTLDEVIGADRETAEMEQV